MRYVVLLSLTATRGDGGIAATLGLQSREDRTRQLNIEHSPGIATSSTPVNVDHQKEHSRHATWRMDTLTARMTGHEHLRRAQSQLGPESHTALPRLVALDHRCLVAP